MPSLMPGVKAKRAVIFHLGDHDPSGKDMTRDIQDRLNLFMGAGTIEIHRLALNWDQIERYHPPPNPAKVTDSRAAAYIEEFGDESWELDALDPTAISTLIREAVADIIDQEAWDEATAKELQGRRLLEKASEKWEAVAEFIGEEE
jgi:hypothetical protein